MLIKRLIIILLLQYISKINSILHLICKRECSNLVKETKDIHEVYTKEVVRRSMFLGWQDQLIDLWHNKNKIYILAIGGSMTAGFDLPGHRGTWPEVMKDLFASKVIITALAGSGQGSEYFSKDPTFWASIKANPPDILIVEFGINDQQVGLTGMESRTYPQHLYEFLTRIKQVSPKTQIMALVASRITTDINHRGIRKYLNELCPVPTEETALTIYTKSDGVQIAWCHNWWHVATIQQTVYRELGIPYFSYRDAIWPFLHTPVDSLTIKWNGESHPDGYAHRLMAMGLLKLITMVCETTCSHPDNDYLTIFNNLPSYTSPEYQLESEKNNTERDYGCEVTSTTLIAKNFHSNYSDDRWIYGMSELTHHRLAWRTEDLSGKEQNLIFEIQVGSNYTIMIEYLGSHSFYGDVDVYIETNIDQVKISKNSLFKLSTYWERHLSIPQWKVYHLSSLFKENIKYNLQELPIIYIRFSYKSEFKFPSFQQLPPSEGINQNTKKPLFLLYSISTC